MRNTLALETSTETTIVAACSRDGRRAGDSATGCRRHGRDLIPLIRAILGHIGLAIRDLELIGVGLGPGSYTGLRIGVTAAKTLAYATGARVVGIGSPLALARNAPAEALEIAVLVDAQRDDVYLVEFGRVESGLPLVARGAGRVQSIASWLAARPAGQLAIGPALESPRIRARMPPGLISVGCEFNQPDWGAVLDLVLETHEAGRRDDPWSLEPHYSRPSAAEEKRLASLAAAAGDGKS